MTPPWTACSPDLSIRRRVAARPTNLELVHEDILWRLCDRLHDGRPSSFVGGSQPPTGLAEAEASR